LIRGGEAVDLKQFLPPTSRHGGRFRVRTDLGRALPTGVTLSPSGRLSAAPDAPLGSIKGVVYDYDDGP
jgi:hypothetical protein